MMPSLGEATFTLQPNYSQAGSLQRDGGRPGRALVQR